MSPGRKGIANSCPTDPRNTRDFDVGYSEAIVSWCSSRHYTQTPPFTSSGAILNSAEVPAVPADAPSDAALAVRLH